jgi:NhaP-type Na+/H+ or K+/H+ antiporter
VLFGIVEIFGFSGYVAAVVFGVVPGNIEVFHSSAWLGLARTVPVRDARRWSRS